MSPSFFVTPTYYSWPDAGENMVAMHAHMTFKEPQACRENDSSAVRVTERELSSG